MTDAADYGLIDRLAYAMHQADKESGLQPKMAAGEFRFYRQAARVWLGAYRAMTEGDRVPITRDDVHGKRYLEQSDAWRLASFVDDLRKLAVPPTHYESTETLSHVRSSAGELLQELGIITGGKP